MQCHVHGGQQVSRQLLVEHHKHPTGFGGPDIPDNIVLICATCHDLLHKIAEAMYYKKEGKAIDLANQYLPNDPRRRTLLLALSNQAAAAKREYYETHTDEVPEDPDEVEERMVRVGLEMEESLHQRLKIKADDFTHPETGRKVGLYRYILEVLRAHVGNDNKPVRNAPKVPDGWHIT
jgi:hypothetical protein